MQLQPLMTDGRPDLAGIKLKHFLMMNPATQGSNCLRILLFMMANIFYTLLLVETDGWRWWTTVRQRRHTAFWQVRNREGSNEKFLKQQLLHYWSSGSNCMHNLVGDPYNAIKMNTALSEVLAYHHCVHGLMSARTRNAEQEEVSSYPFQGLEANGCIAEKFMHREVPFQIFPTYLHFPLIWFFSNYWHYAKLWYGNVLFSLDQYFLPDMSSLLIILSGNFMFLFEAIYAPSAHTLEVTNYWCCGGTPRQYHHWQDFLFAELREGFLPKHTRDGYKQREKQKTRSKKHTAPKLDDPGCNNDKIMHWLHPKNVLFVSILPTTVVSWLEGVATFQHCEHSPMQTRQRSADQIGLSAYAILEMRATVCIARILMHREAPFHFLIPLFWIFSICWKNELITFICLIRSSYLWHALFTITAYVNAFYMSFISNQYCISNLWCCGGNTLQCRSWQVAHNAELREGSINHHALDPRCGVENIGGYKPRKTGRREDITTAAVRPGTVTEGRSKIFAASSSEQATRFLEDFLSNTEQIGVGSYPFQELETNGCIAWESMHREAPFHIFTIYLHIPSIWFFSNYWHDAKLWHGNVLFSLDQYFVPDMPPLLIILSGNSMIQFEAFYAISACTLEVTNYWCCGANARQCHHWQDILVAELREGGKKTHWLHPKNVLSVSIVLTAVVDWLEGVAAFQHSELSPVQARLRSADQNGLSAYATLEMQATGCIAGILMHREAPFHFHIPLLCIFSIYWNVEHITFNCLTRSCYQWHSLVTITDYVTTTYLSSIPNQHCISNLWCCGDNTLQCRRWQATHIAELREGSRSHQALDSRCGVGNICGYKPGKTGRREDITTAAVRPGTVTEGGSKSSADFSCKQATWFVEDFLRCILHLSCRRGLPLQEKRGRLKEENFQKNVNNALVEEGKKRRFRARPMPSFNHYFIPNKSTRPLTVPKNPNFCLKRTKENMVTEAPFKVELPSLLSSAKKASSSSFLSRRRKSVGSLRIHNDNVGSQLQGSNHSERLCRVLFDNVEEIEEDAFDSIKEIMELNKLSLTEWKEPGEESESMHSDVQMQEFMGSSSPKLEENKVTENTFFAGEMPFERDN